MNYKGFYISCIDDCDENEGGKFCQIYSDPDTLDNEIDNFCLHPEELAEKDEETLIKEYVDTWEDSLRQKHDDYDAEEEIVIKRTGENNFELCYKAEDWTFVCSGEELLEELREHIYLKKIAE